MPVYMYRRVAKLHAGLLAAGVDPVAVRRIMEGGEEISPATGPETQAAWMREAMLRLDSLLEPVVCKAVREKCACCLGGWRLKAAKSIARDNPALKERIDAFDKSGIAGRVTQLKDGRISSSFADRPKPYRCRCLPAGEETMPVSYCQCCGGQIKHHMQIALGRRLSVDVISSVLSSGGKLPCEFLLKLED